MVGRQCSRWVGKLNFFLEKDNGMELGSWEFEVCGTVSRKTAGVRFFVLKTASFMCGIHPHAFLLSVQCSAEIFSPNVS
jgi:hypothetical protein